MKLITINTFDAPRGCFEVKSRVDELVLIESPFRDFGLQLWIERFRLEMSIAKHCGI
jgi:hypothetical protein